MSHDPKGEPLLVVCTIKDTHGKPLEGVKIDIWETDSTGHYDVQYPGRDGPDGRCIMRSDKDGVFWFNAITPVPYPIPHDGPVGKLLKKLHRHPYRPSHMHFMFEKEGYDHLITYVLCSSFPLLHPQSETGAYELRQSSLPPTRPLRDLRRCLRRQELPRRGSRQGGPRIRKEV